MRWRFGAFLGTLKTAALTAARNWTFPDRSGSVVIDQGPAALYNTVVSVTGSKTLALTDNGTLQYCTNGSAATITIPLNATVAFPIGSTIRILRHTALSVSVSGVGGVTLLADGVTAVTGSQACTSSLTLTKVATDTWHIVQDCSMAGRFLSLSQSAPHQARVFRTAALALTAVTTPVKLDFDTTTSQSPASSISNNGRYTVTTATTGIYLVTAFLSFSSSAVCTLNLNVNVGGVLYRTINAWANFTAGNQVYLKGSCIVHLPSNGNYVEVAVGSNAATNLTFAVGAASCYCDIVKIA